MLPNRNQNRKFKINLLGSFFLLLLSLCLPVVGQADQANYVYDELGRLFRVIDGSGNVATYHYDPVGNLLEITRETTASLSPTLASISPDFCRQGSVVNVTLTGTNLDASSLTTDNPGITVTNTQILDSTTVTARFLISETATVGTTIVEVDNGVGTANLNYAVHPLPPKPVILPPFIFISGGGGNATASIRLEFDDGFPSILTISTDDPNVATVFPTQIELQPGGSQVVTLTGVNLGETKLVARSAESTSVPVFVGPIRDMAAGGNHSCAILSDGTVKCWGSSGSGQVGVPSPYPFIESTPVIVPIVTTGGRVAGGENHTCSILSNGTMRCWGRNSEGQLGNGTFTSSSTPVLVSGLFKAVDVTAGESHSCALISDGTIKCWGRNDEGELGDGTFNSSSVPVTVSGITNAVAFGAGRNHTCVVLTDGTIKCWGQNNHGQLGNGTFIDSSIPIPVTGISNASKVAGGNSHTCSLLVTGKVKCWGNNGLGEMGNGTSYDDPFPPLGEATPVNVTGVLTAVDISANVTGQFTCVVLADTTVQCWGLNERGELGVGTLLGPEVCGPPGGLQVNCSRTPVSVVGLNSVALLSSGGRHSCAFLEDGTGRCWGNNANGQLGNGTNTTSFPWGIPTPVNVLGF
jgi:YD repeat-containing protein